MILTQSQIGEIPGKRGCADTLGVLGSLLPEDAGIKFVDIVGGPRGHCVPLDFCCLGELLSSPRTIHAKSVKRRAPTQRAFVHLILFAYPPLRI